MKRKIEAESKMARMVLKALIIGSVGMVFLGALVPVVSAEWVQTYMYNDDNNFSLTANWNGPLLTTQDPNPQYDPNNPEMGPEFYTRYGTGYFSGGGKWTVSLAGTVDAMVQVGHAQHGSGEQLTFGAGPAANTNGQNVYFSSDGTPAHDNGFDSGTLTVILPIGESSINYFEPYYNTLGYLVGGYGPPITDPEDPEYDPELVNAYNPGNLLPASEVTAKFTGTHTPEIPVAALPILGILGVGLVWLRRFIRK